MEQVQRIPCPYCRELILPGAMKCKECASHLGRRWSPGQSMVWARNLPDRKVLGVAACIAANLRISATLVRLGFVLLTFLSLIGLFLYIGLAFVIPGEAGQRSPFEALVDAMGAALDNIRNPSGNRSVTNQNSAPLPPATAAEVESPPSSGTVV